jgi:UDP-N-acetylmuramoylalanine--D-glutamate ligase
MKKSFEHSIVLVIGLGISGKSAANCLLKLGAGIIGADQHAEKLLANDPSIQALKGRGAKIVKDDEPIDLSLIDYIVISPGVPMTHPLCQAGFKGGKEIIGEVELACRLFSQDHWIGITGTNGKTTATLLITHVLNECGVPAVAVGNVGVPISSHLTHTSKKVIVAELSSFQLESMQSKILNEAVILNITPDHLDRYASMREYGLAKMRIGHCLKSNGVLFIEEKTEIDWENDLINIPCHAYGYMSNSFIQIEEDGVFMNQQLEAAVPTFLKGQKNHDILNVLAAYGVCRRMGIPGQDIMKAAFTFRKPPHRIEFVTSINGVDYFDDSKGTNLDAVVQAVNSMKGPVILIAGGVHKGASYTPWRNVFQNKVKRVFAIGQAAPLIFEELSSEISVEIVESLDQAVLKASKIAKNGDNVLLSPGCSSYDMFKDYAHRGDEFKRLVRRIQ